MIWSVCQTYCNDKKICHLTCDLNRNMKSRQKEKYCCMTLVIPHTSVTAWPREELVWLQFQILVRWDLLENVTMNKVNQVKTKIILLGTINIIWWEYE